MVYNMDTMQHDKVAHVLAAWISLGLIILLSCTLGAWRCGCFRRARVEVNEQVELASVPQVQLVEEDGPAFNPLLVEQL